VLAALDEFGSAAYCCARDGGQLAPISDGSSVQQCPVCGHRTDEPGEGVLGDGFDIVHRQWGLRGDPHAWNALRDLVATTPTPATAEGVRKVFVDGLRQVADVDIDETAESQVYRQQLDHGGMSGGSVNVDWWRAKGIPLLVDRAVSRRPTPATGERESTAVATRSVGRFASSVAVWALLLAIPAALVGGGGWLLYQRGFGTRVGATVLTCDSSGHVRRFGSTFRTDCVAQWTIDGRTVIGNFEGGNGESDVGNTVDATVHGDTAYSRSLGLPLLLIGLGLPFLLVPAFAIKRRVANRRRNDSAPTVSLPAM
jgi:hypothetical protein